jgi:hypothetical protein
MFSLRDRAVPAYTEFYVGGGWTAAEDSNAVTVSCSATGEVLGSFPAATEADIDRAVDAAKRALADPSGWSAWSADERALAMERLAVAVERRGEEMAQLIARGCRGRTSRRCDQHSPSRSRGGCLLGCPSRHQQGLVHGIDGGGPHGGCTVRIAAAPRHAGASPSGTALPALTAARWPVQAGGAAVERRTMRVGESEMRLEGRCRSAMRSSRSRAASRPICRPPWSTLVREAVPSAARTVLS